VRTVGGNRFPRAAWLAVAITLGLVACAPAAERPNSAAGADEQTASPPRGEEPAATVGETVASGPWQLTVTRVAREPAVEWSSLGNTAKAQGVWIVLQVRVENVGGDAALLRAADLPLRDAGGHTYSADEQTSVYYSAFRRLSKPTGSYPPRIPVEVGLVYDVPVDANGLQLDAAQARRTIDLGQ
jgi:Domain of unknown function (DUF4352)